jgi:hypothetical protein
MVSTPNRPDGLFNKIEKESFESCIYKKVFLDYTYRLGKIYSQEEIEKAKPRRIKEIIIIAGVVIGVFVVFVGVRPRLGVVSLTLSLIGKFSIFASLIL